MFKVKDRQITGVEPFEYLPVTEGEDYELGEALTLGETGATKCAADEKPGYPEKVLNPHGAIDV